MDILIKIGRGAQGERTYFVPLTFQKTSRDHAIVWWHDGVVTIEDNGSTNGTFVNGQRITKATITEDDTVWLGGNPTDTRCYLLDLKEVFAQIQKEVSKETPIVAEPAPTPIRKLEPIPELKPIQGEKPTVERTDYSKEFARVKQAYIEYHTGMSKLKKKAGTQTQLPRVFLSMIPAVIGIVILLVSTDMTMRIVGMSVGSVLSGLIGTLTMGSSSSRQEELSEKMLDLQLKYRKEYKCPKCGKEYSLDLHWKKLQADGCPHGCGARFV